MPIYQYGCEFGHILEEQQSIKEYKCGQTKECPECGNVMERVIEGGIEGFVENVTTIGQLGERNFKALGKYKGEEMLEENRRSKKAAEDEVWRSKGIDPSRVPDYKKMKKLANLTPKQKERYIQDGKLP